jgi:hypothetical protein
LYFENKEKIKTSSLISLKKETEKEEKKQENKIEQKNQEKEKIKILDPKIIVQS